MLTLNKIFNIKSGSATDIANKSLLVCNQSESLQTIQPTFHNIMLILSILFLTVYNNYSITFTKIETTMNTYLKTSERQSKNIYLKAKFTDIANVLHLLELNIHYNG